MSGNLSDTVIDCKEISFVRKGFTILDTVSFQLQHNESLAIVGRSGAGKTTLGRLLARKLQPVSGELMVSAARIVMVEQQDRFLSVSGRGNTHYSQRYEAQDTSDLLSVDGYLRRVRKEIGVTNEDINRVVEQTGIAHITDSKLLQLSNGERKRTQLAVALLRKPEMLVLDQPFVGLDVASREKLSEILQDMVKKAAVILICGANQVPDFTDKVLELEKGRVATFRDREAYNPPQDREHFALNGTLFSKLQLPADKKVFDTIVGMTDVNVRLGGKHILKDINWKVKRGEQWALIGHNGAGKTTLLSLITADNPQGYNNNLTLFDRRRGTGESIWDIKGEIGFVSSELHLYFLRGKGIFNTIPGIDNGSGEIYSTLSCLDVIVSGFNDEVGLVTEPSEYQLNIAGQWLHILGLERLEKSLFAHASLGEQRSILLARALVKFPSLLILDEPLQGLDDHQTTYFKALLNRLCETLGTTMIYVSHYRDEIPDCVSHIIEISRGEVVRKAYLN